MMSQKNRFFVTGLFCTLGALAIAAPPASGQIMAVRSEIHHDVSPAVRDMPIVTGVSVRIHEAEPVKPIPLPPDLKAPGAPDSVLQQTVATAPSMFAPVTSLNFDGIGQGVFGFSVGVAPPDTNGAVGATQYVQWVNLSFAVFNKSTGALVKGPVAGNSLWSGFGGGCETSNSGDPIVTYDKQASRWVFTQFAVAAAPFLQCIAVSTTSDATGTFNRYSFQYSNFDDYPKLAVWPDAYYITFNMFNGNTLVGADACAYNRSAMLNGQAATQICFQQGSSIGSLLPSDLDGATQPPAGSPNYMMNFGSNTLNLFKFHVNFTTPSASAFTGPTAIPVAAFTPLCGGARGCVPQAGTTTQLDSLADRLMYRLAYRNFGSFESLVVNHSVAVGSSSGVRWYEIHNPAGTPAVAQQSTFAPDATFRWMGSIAMDQAGDIALGYSKSSSTTKPAIAFTGHTPSDPSGTMEAETIVINGTGSQTAGLTRWGDYSAMQIDPVDDCTFWYTSEYLKADGSFNWNTRIANFKFGNCQSGLAISVSPSSINFFNHFQNDPPVSRVVTVSNTGTAAISFSGITLKNGFGAYSISSRTCGSSLAAGASCTITVTFTPANAFPGTNTDTLVISDNVPGSPQQVPLTGTLSCPPGGCL